MLYKISYRNKMSYIIYQISYILYKISNIIYKISVLHINSKMAYHNYYIYIYTWSKFVK